VSELSTAYRLLRPGGAAAPDGRATTCWSCRNSPRWPKRLVIPDATSSWPVIAEAARKDRVTSYDAGGGSSSPCAVLFARARLGHRCDGIRPARRRGYIWRAQRLQGSTRGSEPPRPRPTPGPARRGGGSHPAGVDRAAIPRAAGRRGAPAMPSLAGEARQLLAAPLRAGVPAVGVMKPGSAASWTDPPDWVTVRKSPQH